jgi:hypothetical protein
LSNACGNLIGFFGKNATDSEAYDSARNDCGQQWQLETDFWAMLQYTKRILKFSKIEGLHLAKTAHSLHKPSKQPEISVRSFVGDITLPKTRQSLTLDSRQRSSKRVALSQSLDISGISLIVSSATPWIVRASYKYRRKTPCEADTAYLRSGFDLFAVIFAKIATWRVLPSQREPADERSGLILRNPQFAADIHIYVPSFDESLSQG